MDFVTTINCMDGKTQLPVIEWMKQKFNAKYVDSVTEPGPVKILAENTQQNLLYSIRKRLDISVNIHKSTAIAIVAHYGCAGNPVEKEVQIKQIALAIETVKSWGFGVKVLGLWVNENWEVESL